MALFRSLLSWLGEERTQPRPIALKSSILGSILPDLILQIADFLPLSPVASLSISCMTIKSIVGTRYLEELKRPGQELELWYLLAMLDRDLHGYIACRRCLKLHSMDDAEFFIFTHRWARKQRTRRENPPLPRCYVQGAESDYIYHNFSTTVCKMAMKLYRLGHPYTHVLELLSHRAENNDRSEFGWGFASSARIVSRSLIIQTRNEFIIHKPRPQGNIVFTNTPPIADICPHFGSLFMNGVVDYALFRDNPSTGFRFIDGTQRQRQIQEGFNTCPDCLMEFRISFEDVVGHRLAIIVDRWLEIGQSGLEMDTDDTWLAHIKSRNLLPNLGTTERASIYLKFETPVLSDRRVPADLRSPRRWKKRKESGERVN